MISQHAGLKGQSRQGRGRRSERFETVVVGGGQAGLAVGYHLRRKHRSFVILDEGARIGDSWRTRCWDSLRLFTPAGHDGLPGWRFPAPSWSFPTKDELADYLAAYATRFELPVRSGTRVSGLSRENGRYIVLTGDRRFEADNVVVASGFYRVPVIPDFAPELDPRIEQLHSSAYRDPSQLQEGGVLVVGAGNSGADVSLEASQSHSTWLAGRDKGQIPFRIETTRMRLFFPLLWFVASHVLTVRTPVGRKVRPHVLANGASLIRVKSEDLSAAGVERVPKVVGAADGLPRLEDGRVLDVANVIWCTGFRPDFDWIDLPGFGDDAELEQRRGVVTSEPGLYFLGMDFLYSFVSENVGGVGADAAHVARDIVSRNGQVVAS